MRYALCAAALNVLWFGFFTLLNKIHDDAEYPSVGKFIDGACGVLALLLPVSLSAVIIMVVLP